jgi:hypothetical protein
MVEISATPRSPQISSLGGTMFRKEDRAKLSMEKRTELFDKITSKSLDAKFSEISISLSDIEKLDDTYNVAMLVDRARAHCIKYDLYGVFNIVDAKNPATDSKFDSPLGNLFTSYSTISEDAVARSNEWYRRWAVNEEYETDLRLSMDFLQSNTSESLWEKSLEAHNQYPSVQQGGPLIFVIIMKKIQNDTEDAVRYLQESVKKMKLTNFDGENVERAVSLLRGAERRFKNSGLFKGTPGGVPSDFTKWVLDIFQTSSVEAFNSQFALYAGMLSLGRKVSTAPVITPTPNELYALAEQTYLDLISTDSWTGVTTKGDQTHAGFTADGKLQPKIPTCWNCGVSGHAVPECPKPKDPKRIAQNRTKFRSSKNGGGGVKKPKDKQTKKPKKWKWAPPTSEEADGKRVIDGKPYHWVRQRKRWVPDQRNDDNENEASAHLTATVTPPTPNSETTATRRVAFSNTAHVISEALRNLSDSFE